MSDDVIDKDAIQAINSLQQPGEESILAKIVHLYLDESTVLRDEIGRGIVEADTDLLRESAHSLKSSSANVGAMDVSRLCLELENRARSSDLDDAGELFERFNQSLESAQQALREILESHLKTG